MIYSIKKRQNPLNREESKFYATATFSDIVDLQRIADDISKNCTLTPADILAVIQSLVDKLPEYLRFSHKIKLGNFGTFKLSFSAIGQEEETNVSAKDIKNLRVLFTPSVDLKHSLSKVTFTKK